MKQLARSMAETFIKFAYGDDDLHQQSSISGGDEIEQVIVWGGKKKGMNLIGAEEFDRKERGERVALLRKLGLERCTRVLALFEGMP